jgi:hypothetical protein
MSISRERGYWVFGTARYVFIHYHFDQPEVPIHLQGSGLCAHLRARLIRAAGLNLVGDTTIHIVSMTANL